MFVAIFVTIILINEVKYLVIKLIVSYSRYLSLINANKISL